MQDTQGLSKEDLQKIIDTRVQELIKKYFDTKGFTDRKIGDTPTDNFALTPRGYVNMYGSVASRPINSVTGQFFFNTTAGIPMWRRSDGAFVNGVGSVVA